MNPANDKISISFKFQYLSNFNLYSNCLNLTPTHLINLNDSILKVIAVKLQNQKNQILNAIRFLSLFPPCIPYLT